MTPILKIPKGALAYVGCSSVIGAMYGGLHSYKRQHNTNPLCVGRSILVGAIAYPVLFPMYPLFLMAADMKGCPFKKFH